MKEWQATYSECPSVSRASQKEGVRLEQVTWRSHQKGRDKRTSLK